MAEPRLHSYPWARLRAFLWRFQTLGFAERTFGRLPASTLGRRSLFGRHAYLDLARSNAHRMIYLDGERYIKERHLLRRLVRPGMTVVDVGANVGYYMLLFRQLVGSEGHVICFEPELENFVELERNQRLNHLENVTLVRAAVGASDGETPFRSGLNGVVTDEGEGDGVVPMVRLDTALERPPDLIKIDVEGYEGHVLEGAASVIREHRPILFVELHSWMLYPPFTVESIFDFLGTWYAEPEIHLTLTSAGPVHKLLHRYLNIDTVRHLDGPEALLESTAGLRAETLWVVCRPGGGPRD